MSGGIFMKMYDILRKSAIRTKIKASSKKQLLQDIANMASEHVGIPSMNIAKSLQQREILGPTGIGNGVAIPHIKMRGLTKICGFFSSLERPIDFESADKQPVDLIFTILAPENNTGTEHLKALAMVSRFFSDKDIRSKLRSSENAESLFAILTSSEDSKAA
tara:strand:- start:1388 stop:1873 length:486 start_codon:yes stop_codon:yes gene_type:complete